MVFTMQEAFTHQALSQAYTVAIENMINDQHIIGLAVENKLCWSGAWLKKRGNKSSCPNGPTGCTSHVHYLAAHSDPWLFGE